MHVLLWSKPPTPQQSPPTHAFAEDSWTPTGESPVGSLFLSPGSWCTRCCCALQESILQSYVSSGSSVVGLMTAFSKRSQPYPHPEPLSLRQTTANLYLHRRRSNTVLCQSLWGPWVWCTQGLLEPPECLWWEWGFILNVNSPPPTILLGLLFCPWTWDIFSQPLQCLLYYWGFSDLGHGVSPLRQSSEEQQLLPTLFVGYPFTAAPANQRCHS